MIEDDFLKDIEKRKGPSVLRKEHLGHIAQKHEALTGHPIEEHLSAQINRDARKALTDFLREIQVNLKLFTKVSLQEYDIWSKTSHDILNHSPASLAEIFPISPNRNVEFIFNEIEQSQSELGLFLQECYKKAKGVSKKDKAKHAMVELQAHMDRFQGKILSDEDFKMVLKFQDMVEKFENNENIRKLNEHKKIVEILELVMSTQKFLCAILSMMRQKNVKWFNDNESAFGEIALIYQDTIVPSSRFLKLVLHNVGEYILSENDNLPALQILQNAFQKAIDAKIFNQKICIFKETKDGMMFISVKDKICPASNFLANLVLKELQ